MSSYDYLVPEGSRGRRKICGAGVCRSRVGFALRADKSPRQGRREDDCERRGWHQEGSGEGIDQAAQGEPSESEIAELADYYAAWGEGQGEDDQMTESEERPDG